MRDLESTIGDLDSTLALLNDVCRVFADEPNYIDLPSEKFSGYRSLMLVGDLHGDVKTARRVLRFLKYFRLVFVGDYINGPSGTGSSLETILLLLQKKLERPGDILLLRGNHEFASQFQDIEKHPEFRGEVQNAYPSGWLKVGIALEKAFANMPYVVATENGVLILHGGVPLVLDDEGKPITTLDDLKGLPKGVRNCKDHDVVSQIVWNDQYWSGCEVELGPEGYEKNTARSRKGSITSYVYNQEVFEKVMKRLGKQWLIRGHNVNTTGHAFDEESDYQILTLHTCRDIKAKDPMEDVYVAILDPSKEKPLVYDNNPRRVKLSETTTNKLVLSK